MKTNLLKSAVLLASLLGALSSASAETMHARIPFGFSASGTTMPAGPYAISPIAHTTSILLFENEETKVQTIVFARTLDTPAKPARPLTFAADASERMELTNIAAAGWTYELNLHSPKRMLKGVALTLTSGK
ncbi:MAG: hypothetical protein JWO19_4923 [Bryobacterales bacterium]|nr:hypothetical protein [Bryobacterales bacterium]